MICLKFVMGANPEFPAIFSGFRGGTPVAMGVTPARAGVGDEPTSSELQGKREPT
jgi:hypothetical protein